MNLGPAIKPKPPEPGPEWKREPGKDFEVNAKGQKRTCDPRNDLANHQAIDIYIEALKKETAP